jgi:hypothetical protein
MGWIARSWLRALKRAEAELQAENRKFNEDEDQINVSSRPQRIREVDQFGEPLNVQITKASGGKIVRFTKYDRHTDRHHDTIYVISNDEDFTESMTKLINMEMMK